MKLSIIILATMASFAMAGDKKPNIKDCNSCRAVFENCMRHCYMGGSTCDQTCKTDTCRASPLCKHCGFNC